MKFSAFLGTSKFLSLMGLNQFRRVFESIQLFRRQRIKMINLFTPKGRKVRPLAGSAPTVTV